MIEGNIIDTLNQLYNTLTKSEKKIANYIYSNSNDAQYMSITNLAEQCHVAEATIFRFCKALGCDGYNEFKLALAKSTLPMEIDVDNSSFLPIFGKVSPEDSFDEMCQKLYTTNVSSISQTLELLDELSFRRAARLLHKSDRVYCLGQGGSLNIAMEAWGRFVLVSPKFCCIQDSHMQAISSSLLSDHDVIIYVSYSGATKDMMDVLRPAKERGTKVILITRFERSPAAAFADVILLCGSNEGPMQQGSIAAKMALLFTIDVLYNEFFRHDMANCIKNQEITANSIVNKLL